MNDWILLAGLMAALVVCSLMVSVYALYRAHRLSHNARIAADAVREECAAALAAFEARLESAAGAAGRREPAYQAPAAEPIPGAPRNCMNLTKRSQAIRLRRKGESPEQIAHSLELPRQEVELLLKVHDLVLSNL